MNQKRRNTSMDAITKDKNEAMVTAPVQDIEKVRIRLARNKAEVEAAQRLRYKVFYEEYAAKPDEQTRKTRRDADAFDDVADHLIVLDDRIGEAGERIVGTYRLLRQEVAEKHGTFYTSSEYDISPLLGSDLNLLELGRSCVLAEYRTRPVLQLLWQGITDYMLDHQIDLMFGCASFRGTDIDTLARPLSYLKHFHPTPDHLRPKALPERYVDMNRMAKDDLDPRRDFASLPPLIKGYLRLGAGIGDGAVIDEQFDTTDVCIVLPMKEVSARYKNFYGRKVKREIPDYNAPKAAKEQDPEA